MIFGLLKKDKSRIKTKSIDEFVDALQKNGAKVVEAEIVDSRSALSFSAYEKYCNDFSAIGESDKQITLREKVYLDKDIKRKLEMSIHNEQLPGFNGRTSSEEAGEEAYILCQAVADERLNEIKGKLPFIKTELVKISNPDWTYGDCKKVYFNNEDYQNLRKRADEIKEAHRQYEDIIKNKLNRP